MEESIPSGRSSRMTYSAVLPFLAVVAIWLIHLLDRGLVLDLNRWGIAPREWSGLIGVGPCSAVAWGSRTPDRQFRAAVRPWLEPHVLLSDHSRQGGPVRLDLYGGWGSGSAPGPMCTSVPVGSSMHSRHSCVPISCSASPASPASAHPRRLLPAHREAGCPRGWVRSSPAPHARSPGCSACPSGNGN
jgi:hypothetical protein